MNELSDGPTVEELIKESIQSGTYPFRYSTRAEEKELWDDFENGDPKNSLLAQMRELLLEAGDPESLAELNSLREISRRVQNDGQ